MPVKILLVDDSAADRMIVGSMLKDYTILTACDGLEAISMLQGHPELQMMILDLHMPNMDGFQVLEALHTNRQYRNLRIIILTNYDEPENEQKGLRLGAVDYLRKPLQLETLQARIAIHVNMLLIQQALEEKLQTQGLTFDLIFNQAPIGIAISYGHKPSTPEKNAFFSINPMYEQITGRSKEELLALGWEKITHPDDLAEDLTQYARLLTGEISAYSIEKRLVKPDGSIVWVQLSLSALAFFDKRKDNHIALLQDITKRKEMEQALRYNNEHDRWTGLYNRTYLENLLEEDAKADTARRTAGKRALIGINLGAIQSLAVHYGFNYTQRLLKILVNILSAYANNQRQLFCTYENRFVFYQKQYKDKDELIRFSAEIADTLKKVLVPERINGGISLVEITQENAMQTDLLLKNLLIASEYALKNDPHTMSVCYFDAEIESKILREQGIEQELARIAAREEDQALTLQYQPILDLKANQICAFEALARLDSETLGRVPSLEFMPIAEETKLILPIGRNILQQALSFSKKLQKNGFPEIRVSVNISVIQLLDSNFIKQLFELIKAMQVDPRFIGLEITESVFSADFDAINRSLGTLKDAGLHISIDDFGTGYSSFSREQDLKVNTLKIDKTFVDSLLSTAPEKTVVADIIAMAHKFNHITIAEGVEHDRQRQYLLQCGCDQIQGYLVSRPLDEKAALVFLTRQKELSI